jgi:hypothetical protein
MPPISVTTSRSELRARLASLTTAAKVRPFETPITLPGATNSSSFRGRSRQQLLSGGKGFGAFDDPRGLQPQAPHKVRLDGEHPVRA